MERPAASIGGVSVDHFAFSAFMSARVTPTFAATSALRPAKPTPQLRVGEVRALDSRGHTAQVRQSHVTAWELWHPRLLG
jgi:hypothetical protein